MIDLVFEARRKDLGNFEVGRVLPFHAHRMVGPFTFLDHMGPAAFQPGFAKSADVRVAGPNVMTWTKYKGLDPETNLGGAEWLTQGVDFFNSPLTRSVVLSITLNR